jgi:uncharacterized membrane protein YkoI
MGMRWLGVSGLALLGYLGAAPAEAAAGPETCLSPGEIQEAIAQGRVVEPRAAILVARRLVPGADVMRGGLCRDGSALIYQVLVLRKDGRLVHVTIDAPSGKVIGVH